MQQTSYSLQILICSSIYSTLLVTTITFSLSQQLVPHIEPIYHACSMCRVGCNVGVTFLALFGNFIRKNAYSHFNFPLSQPEAVVLMKDMKDHEGKKSLFWPFCGK